MNDFAATSTGSFAQTPVHIKLSYLTLICGPVRSMLRRYLVLVWATPSAHPLASVTVTDCADIGISLTL